MYRNRPPESGAAQRAFYSCSAKDWFLLSLHTITGSEGDSHLRREFLSLRQWRDRTRKILGLCFTKYSSNQAGSRISSIGERLTRHRVWHGKH